MEAGVGLNECLIVEIFAGTGRVTAALKHLGLHSSFGTDHMRSKQAIAPIVLADLSTQAGIPWLHRAGVPQGQDQSRLRENGLATQNHLGRYGQISTQTGYPFFALLTD